MENDKHGWRPLHKFTAKAERGALLREFARLFGRSNALRSEVSGFCRGFRWNSRYSVWGDKLKLELQLR